MNSKLVILMIVSTIIMIASTILIVVSTNLIVAPKTFYFSSTKHFSLQQRIRSLLTFLWQKLLAQWKNRWEINIFSSELWMVLYKCLYPNLTLPYLFKFRALVVPYMHKLSLIQYLFVIEMNSLKLNRKFVKKKRNQKQTRKLVYNFGAADGIRQNYLMTF